MTPTTARAQTRKRVRKRAIVKDVMERKEGAKGCE